MKKSLLFLAVFTIFCGTILNGQIRRSYLKDYAQKEAYIWGDKLDLSIYKMNQLSEILFDFKVKEGKAVLDNVEDFEETMAVNMLEKDKLLKKLFSNREYKLYKAFNEYSNLDRIEYLKDIIDEYSKDEELVSAIIDYRERNILPILRVHRGELDAKITKADQQSLSILRDELYEALDKCIIDCKAKHHNKKEQHRSLEEVLFKEITSQVGDKMSPMNHLITLAKKYEDEIDEEKSHFENKTTRWNNDIKKIHEKYILENHLTTFNKTLESNSVVAWKHVRFDAFFLLLDPSTEEEAKKILKLGLIVMPHLEI